MSKLSTLTPIAAVLAISVAGAAHAAENPFALKPVTGVVLADAHMEGKCGEGKCGGDKGAKEGKCGGDKAKHEGKCGEGKCGEGKCGGAKAADGAKAKHEGKCGEGKCGGAKPAAPAADAKK
ncbi:MAG: hypothetical protein K0S46_677 [Moraxellaceae bacterium]|jgi:uncharacterized low-complexity protein|nr:hypothetical protein [Moraxellaceae bacterium]